MKYKCMILAASIWLTACSSYHMDIPQGRQLTDAQVNTVHTGMQKTEVIQLLGQPLQSNPLDTQRIDYIYTLQLDGGPIQQKQLHLYFSKDVLTKIEKQGYA